jgi:NADP-dependent 3-hydroxy acid dehydrogenase YdfG
VAITTDVRDPAAVDALVAATIEEAMMRPEDVADVVMFALTRPRGMRLMTTTFRPMGEASWG